MNVFDLTATLGLDSSGYENGLSSAKNTGTKILGAVGAAASAAMAAAASAVVALTEQAIESYGELEQLDSGAQLMFGDGYDYIAEKAQNAFNTVQLSESEYLEQVNGLAVGLKTALDGDGEAAAELADRVITAEADVSSATGASLENVQNAFNGVMKGNYQMLDNLQLGITPTKEGLQEVIDKVNEWNTTNGEATAYTIDNYADVESALVDYVEMQGMAGYASDEAATTIQGSVESVKSAWENIVANLANDDADFGALVDNLVESAENAFNNIAPRVETAFNGIAELIDRLGPIVAQKLPELVNDVLPSLLSAAADMVAGVTAALPSLIQIISDAVPDAVSELTTSILPLIPDIIEAILESVNTLLGGISETLPALIPAVLQCLVEVVNVINNNLDLITEAAVELVGALVVGIIDSIPLLVDTIPSLIESFHNSFWEQFPAILEGLEKALDMLLETIDDNSSEIMDGFVENLADIISTAIQFWSKFLSDAKVWLQNIWQNVVNWGAGVVSGVVNWFLNIYNTVRNKILSVVTFIKDKKSEMVDAGANLVQGLWEGFKSKIQTMYDNVTQFASNVVSKVKNKLGIHSPSKVFAGIGSYMAQGLGEGWDDEIGDVTGGIQDSLSFDAGNVTASVTASASGSLAAQLTEATKLLQEYLPQMASTNIYLDSGAMVGQMAPQINSALGGMLTKSKRSVAY